MKLTNAPSKIVGVQLGTLNVTLLTIMREGDKVHEKNHPWLECKFGLLNKEGTITGHLTMHPTQWSEKAQKALEDFVAIVEEEALSIIFDTEKSSEDVPTEQKTKDNNTPRQF